MPKLGIFWGFLETLKIDGKIIKTWFYLLDVCEDAEKTKNIGGFKTYDRGHVDDWGTAQNNLMSRTQGLTEGLCDNYEYDDVPRGRINWIEENNQYLILLDKRLWFDGFIKQLIERFELEGTNYKIMTDSHYSTPNYDKKYFLESNNNIKTPVKDIKNG